MRGFRATASQHVFMASVGLIVVAMVAPWCAAGQKADVCRFKYEPPSIGQQIVQDVHFVLAMMVTVSQDGQVLETTEEGIERRQRRELTVLDTSEGRTTRVRLHYVKADQTRAQHGKIGPTIPQPVVGKSYLVARDASDRLIVTDLRGETPTVEELRIVEQNMVGLGRPNPLSSFLAGKTFRLGETVSLPEALARDLLGMSDTLGEIERVEITLREMRAVHGRPCAVFDTRIEARPMADSGIGMRIAGELIVEIGTSRPVAATFEGPVTLVENQGTPDAPRLVRGRGTLNVVVQSSYRLPQTATRPPRASRLRR